MKRVLVTGAAGFVGANLARRLVEDGHEVHLLVRPGSQSWRIEALRNTTALHSLSLVERDAVHERMQAIRPSWIFHLAAHGAYSSQRSFDAMVDTNVRGTAALVDAAVALRVEAFVYTGSSSEYGSQAEPAAETNRIEPNSHYAITKAAGTHYCQWAARQYGLAAVVLRLYSIYGPWEEPTRFVPTLLVRALEGALPPLVAPETARDFVYVADAVDALIRAAEFAASVPPGSIFNVASGRQMTIREAVDCVVKLLSLDAVPEWGSMDNRVWDTNRWVGSPAAIASSLNWSAGTSFEEGLRQTIAWLRDNPAILHLYRQAQTSGVRSKP